MGELRDTNRVTQSKGGPAPSPNRPVDVVLAPERSDAMLVDLGPMMVAFCLLDESDRVTWMNATCRSRWPSVTLPKYFLEMLHPEDGGLVAKATEGTVEIRAVGCDGQTHWCELRIATVPTISGVGRCAVLIDTDAHHDALEHERALRHELRHRLRNLLSIVIAITADTLGNDNPNLSRLIDRLQTLDALGQVGNDVLLERMNLPKLIRRVLQRFIDLDSGRFILDGEEREVSRRLGNTLALLLHELATNAIKYGALSGPSGQVTLRWHADVTPPRPLLHLEWRELGGPTPQPGGDGFGLKFIRRLTGVTMGAETNIRFPATGAVCHITLPLV